MYRLATSTAQKLWQSIDASTDLGSLVDDITNNAQVAQLGSIVLTRTIYLNSERAYQCRTHLKACKFFSECEY